MKKITLILLVIISLMSCETNQHKIEEQHDFFTQMKYRDQGKSIARNAMILYLDKSDQLKDGVTIELDVLLNIEDSLTKTYDND